MHLSGTARVDGRLQFWGSSHFELIELSSSSSDSELIFN